MKKSVMLKWVKALRSGKYKQGEGRLHWNDNTFCCLGVLCDISKQGEWKPKYFDAGYTLPALSKDEFTKQWTLELPPEVMEWAGIKHPQGRHFGISGNMHHLSDYNDGKELRKDGTYKPVTFLEMADWLTRNYKAL